jgi:chromosomal replication initiation ATPase DnaA
MLDHLIRKIGKDKAIEILLPYANPSELAYKLNRDNINAWVESTGYDPDKFWSKSRKREYVAMRYIVWYYMNLIGYSFKYLGRMFKKDHSTIMHGVDEHRDKSNNKDAIYAPILQSFNDFFGLD